MAISGLKGWFLPIGQVGLVKLGFKQGFGFLGRINFQGGKVVTGGYLAFLNSTFPGIS